MGFFDLTGLDSKLSKSNNPLRRVVVLGLDGLLVVVFGRLGDVLRGTSISILDGFFLDEETSLSKGSSAISLQNGVVQRQALMFEEPGSEISLRLQSSSAVKGLSMGPNNTLVGKHSLKTAEKAKKDICALNIKLTNILP